MWQAGVITSVKKVVACIAAALYLAACNPCARRNSGPHPPRFVARPRKLGPAMRLCTYSVDAGALRLGADCGRAVLDLARYSHLHDGLRLPADMQGLLDAGPDAWRHAADLCRRFASELESHDLGQDAEAGLAYPADRVRYRAPIPRPKKDVIRLGQNAS